MRILEIAKIEGDTLELMLPDELHEITLRAKLDFEFNDLKVLDYLSNMTEFNSGYYLYLLCKVLSDFFISNGGDPTIDINDFIEINVADLVDEDGNLLPEVLQTHLSQYERNQNYVVPDDVRPTLIAIYDHIKCLLNLYQPNLDNDVDYSFEYKGETYKVFKKTVDRLYGENFDEVSVGELTEAFEISRRLQKGFSVNDASVQLTEILGIISVVARKEGEPFPMEDKDKFIQQRSKHFLDIDFVTASNVFFCLMPTSDTFIKGMTSDGSLNLLKEFLQNHPPTTRKSWLKKIDEHGSELVSEA